MSSTQVTHRRSRASTAVRVLGVVVLLMGAAVLALAVVPVSTGGLVSSPDPSSGYANAVARFEQVRARERREGVYGPCRSRLLDHGRRSDVVVVLVHGLTNCPRQFVELGERVHATGANVLILRVPRHGLADRSGRRIGSVSNVSALTPEELAAYGDEAVDIAAGLGEDVRVLGLSMGGVVAAWIAQNRMDIDRVVAVSPALTLPHVPGFVDAAYRNLFSRLPNVCLPGSANLDHAYAGESTRALAAMYRLAESVRDDAGKSAPAAGSIAVVTNAADDHVKNSEIRDLAKAWREGGADVESYEFPRALGLPHDLIDPGRRDAKVDVVYPVLLGLLGFGG